MMLINLLLILNIIILNVIALRKPDLLFEYESLSYYFIYDDNTYCKIKDDYTIRELGYNKDDWDIIVDSITDTNYQPNNRLNCPVSLSMFKNKNECDILHKIAYNKTIILTNNIQMVDSVLLIGEYFNPAFLPNGKQFLMSRRQAAKSELLTCNYDYTNVNELVYDATSPLNKFEEDIRLFRKPNGNVLLILSNYYEKYYYVYTGIRELIYDKEKNKYKLTNQLMLDFTKVDKIKSKNWMPFTYNNEIYLIEKMFPLSIYRYPDINEVHNGTFVGEIKPATYVYRVDTLSFCEEWQFEMYNNWRWAEVRGGTPLVYIPKIGYLGFFHSKCEYCNRKLKLYFMGAFILSSSPPFQITHMTTQPIITKDLIYNPNNAAKGQSVVFPMSFYIIDKNNKIMETVTSRPYKIILSIGYKDEYGLSVTIDYNQLIRSLVHVTC